MAAGGSGRLQPEVVRQGPSVGGGRGRAVRLVQPGEQAVHEVRRDGRAVRRDPGAGRGGGPRRGACRVRETSPRQHEEACGGGWHQGVA